ncbi:MAG TPA: sigma-70 family RNA polymerase sigma factor [Gemmatimonadales bacterium]|nr:sigma-70 family RNA polymerase sigma factor [Gemmatimonadales bacterium]
MTSALAGRRSDPRCSPETTDTVPPEVARLLGSLPGQDQVTAWQAFVERYSRLLLRVAFDFAPGYDDAMDRYAFILDELHRDDFRRLQRFVADGRGRFSTWLTVVARRLCLDQHRCRYGRTRRSNGKAGLPTAERLARRRLVELTSATDDVDRIGDVLPADPGDELGEAERREALRRAFRDLAPEDQLLLKLRFEKDLTAGEIAVLLRMPTPFHVYRRLRSLCHTLRARLHGEGVDA